jgi:flagellar biosynthesis protein FlhF
MNLKRFTGRTTRDAMQKVKAAFGHEAIVLSTKPCPEGVEIIAMAADAMTGLEKQVPPAPPPAAPEPLPAWAQPEDDGREVQVELSARAGAVRATPPTSAEQMGSVQDDVRRLAMSTLSFQDYVRERMLKRRQHSLKGRDPREGREAARSAHKVLAEEDRTEPRFDVPVPAAQTSHSSQMHQMAQMPQVPPTPQRREPVARPAQAARAVPAHAAAAPAARPTPVTAAPVPPRAAAALPLAPHAAAADAHAAAQAVAPSAEELRMQHLVAEPPRAAAAASWSRAPVAAPTSPEMMNELREMKDLIEERFGAIAFMQRLQRSPAQASVSQKLLECGFSPVLVRRLIDGMPEDILDGSKDPLVWATRVLEHNLSAAEREVPIENQGGVFALVGSTGTGKTTSTAKIAAAFAAKHGANNLGLVTLDAYRVGAHEQLRTYGRILGVPVHTAHDRPALEDLLDLLSAKKLVLIDTAGIAQRDARTKELLEMISHRSINRLLVVNASSQGETIEDVMHAYRASTSKGVIVSKLDEAVKLGPALDAIIRHRLPVYGVANGQRVPEDWHCLSSSALIQRALRYNGSAAHRLDAEDLNLIFALSSTPGGDHARAALV